MEFLAPSTDPFRIPSDRDMLPSERRLFVNTHHICVLAHARRNDGPAQSVVSYIPTDEGDLLVVTMAARSKAKAVERLGKVSLAVLDELRPLGYLTVYCNAVVERDLDFVVDVAMAAGARISGKPLSPAARPGIEAMMKKEDRVVLRCTPYATFATPPRQPSKNAGEPVTHWLSGSVPWDATDPE